VPSVLSILATYAVMRWIFRQELRCTIEAEVEQQHLDTQGMLVIGGLALVVAILLIASALGMDLGLPTCLAALAVTAVVSIRARSNPWKLATEISWSTLALVAGLFILVDAAESAGALRLTGQALAWAQSLAPAVGALVAALVVGVGNNLVNNLPLGLIAGGTLQAAHANGLIADVVLIGVDLGPNLSITGSLATILWLLALRKQGVELSFWLFLRVGAFAMPIAMALAVGSAIAMRMLLKG
jgi:arsenical pump membrane protein